MAEAPSNSSSPIAARGLPLEGLIGAPLVAASHANGMMARQQAHFLLDTCFEQDGGTYHPVMIQMSLERAQVVPAAEPGGASRIERSRTVFQLPLLSIIPINSLAVESVELDFHMEVTSQQNATSGEHDQSQSSGKGRARGHQLHGSISHRQQLSRDQSDRSSSSKTSDIAVTVKAGNLPLPRGLTTLLDLYQKAIQPTASTGESGADQ